MDQNFNLDAAKAAHLAYCSLIVSLHKQGVLPISAVVNELGNQIDADIKRHPERRTNPQAQLYYDTLIQVEACFSSQRQSPPAAAHEGLP